MFEQRDLGALKKKKSALKKKKYSYDEVRSSVSSPKLRGRFNHLKPWVIMCTDRFNVKKSYVLLTLHLCVCIGLGTGIVSLYIINWLVFRRVRRIAESDC